MEGIENAPDMRVPPHSTDVPASAMEACTPQNRGTAGLPLCFYSHSFLKTMRGGNWISKAWRKGGWWVSGSEDVVLSRRKRWIQVRGMRKGSQIVILTPEPTPHTQEGRPHVGRTRGQGTMLSRPCHWLLLLGLSWLPGLLDSSKGPGLGGQRRPLQPEHSINH